MIEESCDSQRQLRLIDAEGRCHGTARVSLHCRVRLTALREGQRLVQAAAAAIGGILRPRDLLRGVH